MLLSKTKVLVNFEYSGKCSPYPLLEKYSFVVTIIVVLITPTEILQSNWDD